MDTALFVEGDPLDLEIEHRDDRLVGAEEEQQRAESLRHAQR
jgi:hypothetical protein